MFILKIEGKEHMARFYYHIRLEFDGNDQEFTLYLNGPSGGLAKVFPITLKQAEELYHQLRSVLDKSNDPGLGASPNESQLGVRLMGSTSHPDYPDIVPEGYI
ncbi:MAG: hypothetical protein HY007_03865 [Candidatus Sungbacteria bacterium]|nr:hypothetical protein [Candidatus Sungbacteria bacterium]